MLTALIRRSLRAPWVTCIVFTCFALFAVLRVTSTELDVFPEFVPAQLSIQTEAPGFSPENIESLVTSLIESAVSGVGKQDFLRSESTYGLSVITIVFKDGSNLFQVRQMISERLAQITPRLPYGVLPPQLAPLTSSTADLLKVGLTSDRLTPMELREFADYVLKPLFLSVTGVAKCTVFGGEVKQLQVQLDPGKLALNGVSPQEVIDAVRRASGVRGVGTIDGPGQEIVIDAVGQVSLPEQLALTPILTRTSGGRYLSIGEVSKVGFGSGKKIGDALINGKPGVLLSMASQYGANTLETTRNLEKSFVSLQDTLSARGITLYPSLHRPASFIENSLGHVKRTIIIGGFLVAVVLLLFLGDLRSGFVSLLAIPLSLLGSVIGLQLFGYTLNTLTIGGMAIAIGEVVDDAIIDVENIYRRLREYQRKERTGLPLVGEVKRIIERASLEIRSSVLFATAVVVVVFLPVLGMGGIEGSFFKPLATSYILSILASLVVAVSLTPTLMFLSVRIFGVGDHQPGFLSPMRTGYEKFLGFLLRNAWISGMILVVLLGMVIPLLPGVQFALLPDFQEGHLVIQVRAAPGVSLTEMRRLGKLMSEDLLKHPAISTVEEQIGRAELSEDTWRPNRAEFHVELKSHFKEDPRAVPDDVRSIIARYPGIQFEVLSFLGDRISETITGETAPLVVRLFGNDLDLLDRKAIELAGRLKVLPGLQDISVRTPAGGPTLSVELNFQQLATHGLRALDVLEVIQATYQGTTVGQLYSGTVRTDIVVQFENEDIPSVEEVRNLLIRAPSGALIPIRGLATLSLKKGRQTIAHEGLRRKQTVTARFNGGDVAAMSETVHRTVAEILADSPDINFSIINTAQVAKEATGYLILNLILVILGLMTLLYFALGGFARVLLVVANIPFAFVGGVVAICTYQHLFDAVGEPWTLGTVVGFITLFGMTMRTSIMLLTHYDHLLSEGAKWSIELIIRGAADRLIPILMTAIVTGVGLVPIALTPHEAGHEIEGPMAWVIIGGLITSTLLSLTVLPVMAGVLKRFHKEYPVLTSDDY